MLKANDLATMVTGKRSGHALRSLRTQYAREYSKAEYGGASDEELAAMAKGVFRLAVEEGDLKHGCFLCGQLLYDFCGFVFGGDCTRGYGSGRAFAEGSR